MSKKTPIYAVTILLILLSLAYVIPHIINGIIDDPGKATTPKEEEITAAINDYIIGLDVGDTVIYNEIVKTIMGVEGVYNCDLTVPSADVSIDTNKIALLGSVTLS